jgi:hypothetical protein
MKPDNDAQAFTPEGLGDDEIIPSPATSACLPQNDTLESNMPMTSVFGWLRTRHYIYITLFTLTLLFLYRYNDRDNISLPTSAVEDTVRWDSLTESEQLAEAVTALSLSEDPRPLSVNSTSITLVKTLDHSLVPQIGQPSNSNGALQGRLIVVGDIHGMRSDLERLLAKLDFDSTRDHLVCAGDMINKGPDSVGVLKLLMQLGASAVRGNHEDRVLQAWNKMHAKPASTTHNSPSEREYADSDGEAGGVIEARGRKHKDKALAKQVTNEQVKWLKDLPLILKVGNIKGIGSLVVVHAGLMPGLQLKMQDPYMVMNIRTINLKKRIPSESHKGSVWTKVYFCIQLNRVEEQLICVPVMEQIPGPPPRR